MEIVQTFGVAAIIALAIALILFPTVFGIKFTKHLFPLTLLFSLTSASVAVIGAGVGVMFLLIAFWAAIGGGAVGALPALACLIPLGAVTLANFCVLYGFGKICPNCYQQRSAISAILAALTVVLCQGTGIYFVKASTKKGHDGLQSYDVMLGQRERRLLFGYINPSGKFVIEPKYSEAEKFRNGKAVVWPEGVEPDFVGDYLALKTYDQIDKSGKTVSTISEAEHAKLRQDYMYVDPEDYDESHNGDSAFATMARKSGWQEGHGNDTDVADKFFEGLATKAIKLHYVYVDKTGKQVIPKEFTDALRFSEGLAAVQTYIGDKPKWGYITKDGAWAIAPQFDKASPFHQGLAVVGFENKEAWVKKDSLDCDHYRFGYIDRQGKFVIPPIFMNAYSFSEGLAAVRVEAGREQTFEDGQKFLEKLKKEKALANQTTKKELSEFLTLCLKSWRDPYAWSDSARLAPRWLDTLESLERDGESRESILASRAVIYTISYPVKIKEAEKLSREVIALNGNNGLAHGVIGHCLSMGGSESGTSDKDDRSKQALAELTLAEKLEPRSAGAEWTAQKGLIYEDINKPDLAISEFSKVIAAWPQDPWGYGSRAHAYLSKEDFKNGLADAEKALQLDAKNSFALKQLASVAIYRDQFDKAIGYLKTAEDSLDPHSIELVEILDMHAKAEDGLGHKKEAEALRKRSRALYQ